MKKLLLITLATITFINVNAQTAPIVYVAGDGTGDFNCDGTSDQVEINQALDYVAANSAYTTVYLKGPNTYWIDEPIYISANTTLEGDSSAIVKLIDNANWNTQYKPLIGQKGTQFILRMPDESVTTGNITIRGFELDGNRINQTEPAGASYYRMIQLQNCYNVTVNDMYIHHGLADGIILEWSEQSSYDINSKFYNNRIHYDGHDGIYLGQVRNFEIYNNNVTNTRTDASFRMQNCNNFKIHDNITGNAPDRNMSGVSAVHIMNYGNRPIDDVEIYNNFFYGNQVWHGIWLEQLPNGGAASLNTHTGVYIHNNIISQYRLAGIGIYGFNNTRIENNTIEISAEDAGITFYSGDPINTSLSGFQTFVKNNIIVRNYTYGIDNKAPSIHTFISEYNCINGNLIGNYNNVSSTTDIYTNPNLSCEYYFDSIYNYRYYNATSYHILSPIWNNADDEGDWANPECRTDLGANAAWNIYHLQSEYGRWDSTQWVIDTVTSPCIDAGDPIFDYSNEPTPNGSRINIGAFGNTTEASKSSITAIGSVVYDNLIVSPNPTSTKIFMKRDFHECKYEITSITGSIVKMGKIKTNIIDLSELNTGIYFIKIYEIQSDKINIAKIIKK